MPGAKRSAKKARRSPKRRGSAERQPRAFVVLGSPGSDPSVLSRILELLGAEGTGDAAADLAAVNADLLAAGGSSLDDLSAFPESPKAAAGFHERALEILRRGFDGSPLFVLQDPAISRLVPFWLSVDRAQLCEDASEFDFAPLCRAIRLLAFAILGPHLVHHDFKQLFHGAFDVALGSQRIDLERRPQAIEVASPHIAPPFGCVKSIAEENSVFDSSTIVFELAFVVALDDQQFSISAAASISEFQQRPARQG